MSEVGLLGPTFDGSVMVDIGGDMGALVIITPPEMVGHEIEISPTAPDAVRVHAAVRGRIARNRPARYAAVFASLLAGGYTVWRHKGDDEQIATVTLTGGLVTEIDWPGEVANISGR